MLNSVFMQLGIGPAGNTFVFKTVEPGRKNYRPFCPEVYLATWDRLGLDETAEILGETVLRTLKVYHKQAFAPFGHLTPPTGDEDLRLAQIEEAERAAVQAETVTPLAPFTFDGDMRDKSVVVSVGVDNSSLRLAPFIGDHQDGMGISIALDAFDALEPRQAWAYLGEIVLRQVAALHPEAFEPFDSFASLLSKRSDNQPN